MKKFYGMLTVLMVTIVILGCSKCAAAKITLSYEKEGSKFIGQIDANDLKKNSSYMLCLNGKVGQDGNEQLKKYGEYGGEGYYDFMEIETDEQGHFTSKIDVELPEGKYNVTFLVKDVSAQYKAIFIKNYVKFVIKNSK
jgi:hypothetical protein